MKKILTISLLLISIVILCPASAFAETFHCVYKGKIAGKNVRVELSLYGPNDSVRGTYYYYDDNGKKLSSVLTLKGKRTGAHYTHEYFTLKETYNGKYCGKWEIDRMPEGIYGTFYSPKGKQYEIELYPVD